MTRTKANKSGKKSPESAKVGESPKSRLSAIAEEPTADLNALIVGALREARNEGTNCDVVVKVDGQEFKAHMSVLSSLSSFFKDMYIVGGLKDGVVDLPKVRKETFSIILDFMYGDKDVFEANDEHILSEALGLAEVFHLELFKSECLSYVDKMKGVELGKCFELFPKLGKTEEASSIVDRVYAYFIEATSLDFGRISVKLMEATMHRHAQACPLDMERKLKFFMEWLNSNRETDVSNIQEMVNQMPLSNYPMRPFGTLLAKSEIFMNLLPDPLRIRMSQLINVQYKRLAARLAESELALWVVEYHTNVVIIKEYDFYRRSYRSVTKMLGMKVESFCVSDRHLHLLGKTGLVTFNADSQRFSDKHPLGHDDPGRIAHSYSKDNKVYVLCSPTKNTYQLIQYDFEACKSLVSVYIQSSIPTDRYCDGRCIKELVFSMDNDIFVLINNESFRLVHKGNEETLGFQKIIYNPLVGDIVLSEKFAIDRVMNHSIYSVHCSVEKSWLVVKNETFPKDVQIYQVKTQQSPQAQAALVDFESFGFVQLELDENYSEFGVVLVAKDNSVKQ